MDILYFLLVWVVFGFVFEMIAGWKQISNEDINILKQLTPIYIKHFSSIWINWIGYRGCIVVKFYPQGIFLKPYLIFTVLNKGIFLSYKKMIFDAPDSSFLNFFHPKTSITYNGRVLYLDSASWEMVKKEYDQFKTKLINTATQSNLS
ncbi:MAG: hypothetical protein WCJ58_00235 [bacterium]